MSDTTPIANAISVERSDRRRHAVGILTLDPDLKLDLPLPPARPSLFYEVRLSPVGEQWTTLFAILPRARRWTIRTKRPSGGSHAIAHMPFGRICSTPRRRRSGCARSASSCRRRRAAVGDYRRRSSTGNLLFTVRAVAVDRRRPEIQGQDRRGIEHRAGLSGVSPPRAQRHCAAEKGARQPRPRQADHPPRRHHGLRAGLSAISPRCSTAPPTSSTRCSGRAAATPAWSIRITKCRWIARHWWSSLPRFFRATAAPALATRFGRSVRPFMVMTRPELGVQSLEAKLKRGWPGHSQS